MTGFTPALCLFAVTAATVPAFAATSCPAPLVLQGNVCVYSTSLGWIGAGQTLSSIFTIYVPPSATGPVDFEITSLKSTLGDAYTGYLGVAVTDIGDTESVVLTQADLIAGGPAAIGNLQPGELRQTKILNVCWDPTCTQPAPAGAVPNVFSMELSISSPNPNDVELVPNPNVTIQFHNGELVTFEERVAAGRANAPYVLIPGVAVGATPAARYVYSGSAVTQPFVALAITNLKNTAPIGGTITIRNIKGDAIANATIPNIAAGGAGGFLLIGRRPGDAAGLFPSDTVLPASADGVFHGSLVIHLTGQTPSGRTPVMAQQYEGNAMLNLQVIGSQVP